MFRRNLLVILLAVLIEPAWLSHQKCDPICPEWTLDPSKTIDEIQLEVLRGDGPDDGICVNPKLIKWIYNGSRYNLENKCLCLNISTGEGEI